VVSEFRGVSAESIRSYFKSNDKEDIQKNYLQYYARRFPQIQSNQPVDYQELPGGVGCTVRESYVIPGIWQITDDKSQYKVTLYPNDIDQEMGAPGAVRRNDPLAVNHPVNISQEIRAEMFEDWPIKPSQRDVSNAFFHFRHDSNGTGRALQMNYSFTSFVDQVSVTDLPSYDSILRSLKDKFGYTLTYSTPEQMAGRKQQDPNSGYRQFNWPIAILLGAIMATVIPLTVRFYQRSKRPESLPPSLTHRSLEGIGGWLALVAFGLLFRPLVFLHANVEIGRSIFNLETWQNLTHVNQPSYHPYWMPTLLFELIYNSVAFVLSILLLVLFFKKRAIWPRCFILFFVLILVGLFVDYSLGQQIPAAAAAARAESTKAIGQAVFASMIWIPYCLTSKRVKATFRH
jgi:hypothetical protein